MPKMNSLEELRLRIDSLDREIAVLFEQRMKECRAIFEYKEAAGLPVYDPAREAELIEKNASVIADAQIREKYISLEKHILSHSKEYQKLLAENDKSDKK